MSGGILRFPWTTQPQSPVGIDPYWLARGLVFLNLGNGVYWKKDKGWSTIATITGGPKTNASKLGKVKGFGSTNGTGSTDRIDLPAIPMATGFRSIVAHLFANSTGGGTFGRVWQDVSGTGTSAGESFYINTSAGFTYYRQTSGTQGGHYSVTAPPMGVWFCAGLTADQTSTAVAQIPYLNGVKDTTTVTTVPDGTYTVGTTTPTFGNRASGDRGWNGMLGPIALFDHPTSGLTGAEHKALNDNIWQLLAPVERKIWVPNAGGGGPTYTLTADSASYTLTGQATGLTFNRVLTADTQSFALTGQAAGLAFNRTLAAASGSFALTGQDAGLAFNRVLSAASGSYALDGQDVTLTYTPISGATYTLTAASGSFALAGQDTGLAFNRVLTADTQSYSLSGDVAGLAFNRVLTADTVSYALTGQDVTLTYTSNGFTYTLTAESGSFEVIGQDASLQHTTTAIAGGGGWLPQTRRKSRKQIYEERVKLGILPPPVIKAAAKVAAVAQTVEEFKEERPKYEEMFLKAIKKTEWLPDYTRAIQAQLAIIELEEEELLLLL